MGYRNDHNAQRLRAEQLEAELGDAKRELADLREQVQVGRRASHSGEAEQTADARPHGSVSAGLVLIVLGPLVAVVVPLPPIWAAGTVLVVLGLLLVGVGRLLHIGRPCDALVVAGRSQRLADGTASNVFVQVGGRVLRRPFVETLQTLDLRVMAVELALRQAYCRDGTAVTVAAEALVQVTSEPARLRNAVERFLSMPPSQIATVAQQTLEGVLRELISRLGPEELDRDRIKVNESLARGAKDELDRLGVRLAGFWLMEVADDQRRLEERRRKRLAEVLRDAEIRESAEIGKSRP